MKLNSILLFFGLTFSSLALGQSLPDFPFIVVSGSSEIEIPPDIATISINISAFNEDSELALNIVSQRGEQLVNIAEKYNIATNEIFSYSLDKYVSRERDVNNQNGEIIGYEISQSFQITIRDISVYSEFIDEVLSMQNVGNVNPTFDVSNRKGLLQDLVKAAGLDAKERADNLAEGLGVEIRNVFAINEDESSFGAFFAKFGLTQDSRLRAQAFMMEQGRSMNMFVPKTITLNKTIDVVYKIRP